MAKGNPSPIQTEEFKSKQFRPLGEVPGDMPLSKKVTGVRLPIDVQQAISALPKQEKITWLRRVISDAARTELIEGSSRSLSTSSSNAPTNFGKLT